MRKNAEYQLNEKCRKKYLSLDVIALFFFSTRGRSNNLSIHKFILKLCCGTKHSSISFSGSSLIDKAGWILWERGWINKQKCCIPWPLLSQVQNRVSFHINYISVRYLCTLFCYHNVTRISIVSPQCHGPSSTVCDSTIMPTAPKGMIRELKSLEEQGRVDEMHQMGWVKYAIYVIKRKWKFVENNNNGSVDCDRNRFYLYCLYAKGWI